MTTVGEASTTLQSSAQKKVLMRSGAGSTTQAEQLLKSNFSSGKQLLDDGRGMTTSSSNQLKLNSEA